MTVPEASRLANQAAGKAHVAKNAFHGDIGLASLAEAVERLAQAVTELSKDVARLGAVERVATSVNGDAML